MNRNLLMIVVALAAVAAGFLVFQAQKQPEETPVVESDDTLTTGAPTPTMEIVDYPSFTMNDMEGNPRDFSEWAGRHRLLNFWATWCAPCRREIPLLKTFQEEQGDDGILVMGIAVDFPEDVNRYAESAQFNYPILVGQEDAMALAESSGVQFVAMPFTMIVSRDGEFLNAYLGELHREQLDTIDSILAELDAGSMNSDEAKAALGLL